MITAFQSAMSLRFWLMCCLLVFFAQSEKVFWNEVSNSALRKDNQGYSAYESCIVDVPFFKPDERADSNAECIAKVGSDSIFKLDRKQTGNSPLDLCLVGMGHGRDSSLRGFEDGYRAHVNNPHHAYGMVKERKCKLRTIADRKGLRSRWEGLKPPSDHWGHAGDMISSMLAKKVSTYIIYGDFVSDQKAKFLACDLARSTGVTVDDVNLLHEKNRNHVVTANFQLTSKSASAALPPMRIVSVSSDLPCRDHSFSAKGTWCDTDRPEFSWSLYNKFKRNLHHLIQTPSVDNRLVMEINFGLLFYQKEHMYKEYFQAILNFAQEGLGTYYVLWRETSAQHFAFRKNGLYDGIDTYKEHNRSQTNDDFCCDALYEGSSDSRYDITADWRNVEARRLLTELDPAWTSYIGWIPYYSFTDTLVDMHWESDTGRAKKRGDLDRSDCTHLIYTPFVMQKHYVQFQENFENFVSPDIVGLAETAVKNRLSHGIHIVRTLLDKTVYEIKDGIRRIIPDAATYEKMGYQWEEVEMVSNPALELLSLGDPCPTLA